MLSVTGIKRKLAVLSALWVLWKFFKRYLSRRQNLQYRPQTGLEPLSHPVYASGSEKDEEGTLSISFSTGGMLWPYYVGFAHFLIKTFDMTKVKVLAASAGCYAAVPLAMGMDAQDWAQNEWSKILEHWTARRLSFMFDTPAYYYSIWDAYLPADAHIRATGKLYISVTLFPTLRGCIVSNFPTRKYFPVNRLNF
jgi:hypothetical protein